MSYARVKDFLQHSSKEGFVVKPTEKRSIDIKLVKVSPSTPHNEMDGAIQWFTFHRGASEYPENPSHHVKERMRGFIWGIPIILRCKKCSNHAEEYLTRHQNKIESAIANRQNLFNFFVDFHNHVNSRQGKKIFSYQEARELYSKPWKAVYPSE
jgi:hypothetical protein